MVQLIDIEIHREYVVILGQKIHRPSRISPSQWLEFWEGRR